jgi:hypothetical protein
MSATTTIRPSRRHAALCSAVGAAVIAVSLWIVIDSGGHGLALALLVAGVVVSVKFVAELTVPGAFTWRLDDDGLEARSGLRQVRVEWGDVLLAQVVTSAGDPALRLDLGGRGLETSRTLLLPVGADLTALHEALARHLGPAATGSETPDRAAPAVGSGREDEQ